MASPEPSSGVTPVSRRARRVLAVAVAAVVLLVGGVGAAVRHDDDPGVAPASTTADTTPDASAASSSSSTSSTIAASTSSVWSRPCTDHTVGAVPDTPDPYEGKEFGPLAPDPGLTILYPLATPEPMYSAPVSSLTRVPNGIYVSMVGTTSSLHSERVIAVVDDVGVVRWRHCFVGEYGWRSVVDTDRGVIDVERIVEGETTATWWSYDLLTGEGEPEHQRTAIELDAAVPRYTEDAVRYDFSRPQPVLRRVSETGTVEWERAGLFAPPGEGFSARTVTVDGREITLVRSCVGTAFDGTSTGDLPCPLALLAVDARTGTTIWQRDGAFTVSLVVGHYAIVSDWQTPNTVYRLLDVETGEEIDGGISSAPGAFLTECCGGYEYQHVEAVGPIAWTVAYDRVNVWYPADRPGLGAVIDLFGPTDTP